MGLLSNFLRTAHSKTGTCRSKKKKPGPSREPASCSAKWFGKQISEQQCRCEHDSHFRISGPLRSRKYPERKAEPWHESTSCPLSGVRNEDAGCRESLGNSQGRASAGVFLAVPLLALARLLLIPVGTNNSETTAGGSGSSGSAGSKAGSGLKHVA